MNTRWAWVRRPPPWLIDGFWSLAFLLAGALEMANTSATHRPLLLLIVPAFAVPLMWRRRAPLRALIVVLVAASLIGTVDPQGDYFAPFAAVLLALYSVGAHSDRRRSLVALGLVLSFFTVGTVLDNLREPGSRPLGDLLYMAALNTTIWGLARLVCNWRQQASQLAQRTAELEQEREWRAQAAVAEERTRIAREMHDAVAHSVSVMVVQAAAAEEMLDIDPARAREPIRRIQQTGRESVLELRRLLGILRPAADEEGSLAPQPTLRYLDVLVEKAVEAGVAVDLRVDGQVRALPPGVEVAGYRVVQEALTNVIKHAGPTSAQVTVRYGDDALDIEVLDQGRVVAGSPPANGTGHGLVGMRERVGMFGGNLSAGPHPNGGFRVRVRLPLNGRVP